MKIEIGEYRLIPKGTKFWSIQNQTNLITSKDEVVEIKHTCVGSDGIFVQLKELLFNDVYSSGLQSIINKGKDEWSLKYSETLPYE